MKKPTKGSSSARPKLKRPVGKLSRTERPAQPSSADPGFPIVGIGASAGGLEALEQFLGHVPPNSGLAFVIVQHLDPTHKGIMPELLQRATQMHVTQVRDNLKIQPNWVYVIPPNKDMSLLHGALHLLEPEAPRGLRLPIDYFFRSLAEDLQDRSIGIILSGMGTDGTLGLRAIKEKAGVALVQDPASAKFDSMPRSAIESGLADVVAPVEALPEKLIAYLQHVPSIASAEQPLEDKTQSSLGKILIVLRARTGQDFSLYKKSTVYRRVERRMGLHQIDRMATYVRFLQENPQEVELLFKELLIGVTSFFRDPATWEKLQTHGLPALLATHPSGGMLRAWVPGCSTGEEAYSLAMTFKEALEQIKPLGSFSLQLFATDLDRDAIDQARQGLYPTNIAADVSPERLRRFFSKDAGGYRVTKDIREMVIFAQQNLIMDPPFTKLDVLTCRNVLIYFDSELQQKLLPLFHYSLNPNGLLLLGSAETIGNYTDLFAPVDAKSRLFRRTDSVRPDALDFPVTLSASRRGAPAAVPPPAPVNLQSLADQLLLQRFSPPAVLVNDQGDILYVSGHTGKYLEPAAGKANWNIFAMAREGLRYELAGAFQKALRQKNLDEPIHLRNIVVGTNGGTQTIDVTLQALHEPEALRGTVLIVFHDVAAAVMPKTAGQAKSAPAHNPRAAGLARELQQALAEVQTTREEMQTSKEELKSMNEELQSANEELQSTNEELTTSKEEMQSLNEELQTVNAELQAKVNELSRTNNDMKNLLNSTNLATLFLDGDLRVRRFTSQAIQLIKLIPTDIGRPVTDLASDLVYPDLAEDAREVLRTLVFIEKSISARDGRWFAMRLMPYRTLDDRIDGLVITFADITTAKQLEAELRQAKGQMEAQVSAMAAELAQTRAQLQAEVAQRQPAAGTTPDQS